MALILQLFKSPTDSNSNHYALRYEEIVVPLVKAVQELSKEVDSLKAANVKGATQRLQNNGNNEDTIKNRQNIILSLPDAPL